MNRRNRTLVVVAVAVVMAAVASFGVYRAIQNIPERTKYIPAHYLVVAKQDVPVGTIIEAQHVRLAGWPQDTNVEGSFAKIEDVLGRGAISPVVINEPITERKLASREAGGGLPPMIPAGMRAMAVKVNDVIGVAGFTVPGTRVDVVVTIKDRDNSVSRAVLSNIQVLSSGTKFDQEQSKNGQAMKTAVVTLLVTPPDAEKLALAQTEGQIVLALRNPMDVEAVQTQGARMSGLMGTPAPAPAVKAVQGRPRVVTPPAPPPVAPKYTVDAIRGAKRSEEIIKDGKGGGQ
ncbi:MAG TPA: Flp pilus assembly protein CpaB [Vicinamibacterales bacterium]|nr:Flp pilus assembly protein CpaB [Vicinamibacterales bacterium]